MSVESASKYMQCVHCDELAKSRGLCGTHYQQARRGGYLSDYPRDEVYQASWCQETLEQILTVHDTDGIEMLEDALLNFRLAKGLT